MPPARSRSPQQDRQGPAALPRPWGGRRGRFHPVPETASAPRGTGADPRRTGQLRAAPREETAPPPEPRDAEPAAGRYLPREKENRRAGRYPREHGTLPTSRPRLATPPPQTEPRPLVSGSDVRGRSGRSGSPCGEWSPSVVASVDRCLRGRGRPRRRAMLRGLGSWLGLERTGEEKLLVAEEGSSPAEEVEEPGAEPGEQSQERAEPQEDTDALLSQAKGFGSECPVLSCSTLPGPGVGMSHTQHALEASRQGKAEVKEQLSFLSDVFWEHSDVSA